MMCASCGVETPADLPKCSACRADTTDVPALCDRKADIPALTAHFLKMLCEETSIRPKVLFTSCQIFVLCMSLAAGASGCTSKPKEDRVQASYDKETGNLSQLTVDAKKDGKPDIYSYMNGSKFVRIEIDNDEDGKIDRWEYYGPDQKVQKIGQSRVNDGIVDSWAYQGTDGLVSKVEVSTRHDGNVSRTEFYEKGTLARAEEDSDNDGQIDKWETYAEGALTTVGFDTTHAGKPTRTIDYRQEAQQPAPIPKR